MKVFVSEEGSGFVGNTKKFNEKVVDKILQMLSPKTKRPDTEYVVKIARGSACIFRVNIGMRPRFIKGSMLVQINQGLLKIGFVDINDDGDIVKNINNVIQNFWFIVRAEANGECAVVGVKSEDSSRVIL
jgi:hypothetical protein